VRNLAQPLGVAVEQGVHDDRAASVGEQLRAQADHAPAGDGKLHAHPPGAMVVHLDHLPFARPQLLDDHADEGVRDIDHQLFLRLHQLAVNPFGHDLGFAHHQLIAFAAHGLDQN